MRSGSGEVPYGLEGLLGVAYVFIGQPERAVEWCRTQLACGRDTHAFTRATLVIALTFAGCDEEARAAANGRHRRSHPQPVGALAGAVGLRERFPPRRSRPRT